MNLKLKRMLGYTGFILFSIVAPLLVVAFQFNLFVFWEGTNQFVKWSLSLLVTAVVGVITFRKKISEWVNDMEPCVAKFILKAIGGLSIYAILFGTTLLLKNNINELNFALGWLLLFNIVSYTVFDPMIEKTTYEIKKQVRQNEMKEVLEAYKNETTV